MVYMLGAMDHKRGILQHLVDACSTREDGGEQDQPGMDSPGQAGRKRGRSAGGASTASRRHIQTEQRRRDKINEGCVTWRAVLRSPTLGALRRKVHD